MPLDKWHFLTYKLGESKFSWFLEDVFKEVKSFSYILPPKIDTIRIGPNGNRDCDSAIASVTIFSQPQSKALTQKIAQNKRNFHYNTQNCPF